MAGANNAAIASGGRADASMRLLNTYIYDYLLKNKQFSCARAFFDSGVPLTLDSDTRREVHGNGVDENGMDGDNSRDDGHDLPQPKLGESSDSSMLFDWWCIFWDIFHSGRNPSSNKAAGGEAMAYLQSIAPNRSRGESISGMRQVSTPGAGQMAQMSRVMPPSQQVMLMQQMKKGQPGQLKMAQEEVNGRPQSPASADNAPSPSKRQRLNGNQFPNAQLAPNGRVQPPTPGGQPMAQSNSQGMMGGQVMDSESLAAMQRPDGRITPMMMQGRMPMQNMQMQNRVMAQMPNQGSPQIMGADGQNAEFYAMSQQQGLRQPGVGSHQGALQDYQMQLMLLEQQNKKRLLQAQQTNADGTVTTNGMTPDGSMPAHFQMAQGMSPHANRPGPSPNPVEQMKRTNTKGGSPMPDGSMPQRGSPAQMNPQMGVNFNGQDPSFYMKNMQDPNGVQMRPPSSFPQGFNPQMAAQMMNAGRGQPQNWPQQMGQPMQQGVQPGQNMGTPRMNPAMPPPAQIPAPGNANRTQPSSPQPNAPPTPQPTKAAAAKKKDTKDRKRPTKKPSAASINAATPSADTEPPQTPLSNPNTPHAQGFAQKNGPPQSMAPAAPMPGPGPIPDGSMGGFGMPQDDFQNMDMGFGPMDSDNVLENFDFDSFLNTGDESTAMNFAFDGNYESSGAVEAGPDA